VKKKVVVRIEQSPEPGEVVEKSVLAKAIVEISQGVRRLEGAGITKEAVIVLTQYNCKAVGQSYNKTKPPLATVRAVLDSLGELQREFVQR